MDRYSEIDKELDTEFPDLFNRVDEEVQDELIDLTDVEVPEDENAETPTVTDDNSETDTTEEESKPIIATPVFDEKKANVAFANLRRENKETKETLEALAKLYEYKDVNSLTEAVKKAQIQKDAKAKGVDPKFYEEFSNMKKKMEEKEQQADYLVKQQSAQTFQSTMERLKTKYNLTSKDEALMYSRLEEDGYALEDVLKSRNYERLITGTLSDIILTRATATKPNVDTGGFRTSPNQDKSVDDMLDEEMRDYAKKRGIRI